MKPEPWGEALDEVLPRRARRWSSRRRPGCRSPRRWPASWPAREHLVFACGRYEGIDQRVIDHAPRPRRRSARSRSATTCSTAARWPRWRSPRPSCGCCPGFMGNPESLPRSRTRTGCWSTPSTPSPPPGAAARCPRCCSPATTRPIAALASRPGGTPHGGAPAGPARTASRCSTTSTVAARRCRPTRGSCFTLQRACWVQEQHANPGVAIPALDESLDDVRAWIAEDVVLVARAAGRLVGAVRGERCDGDEWDIGRLMVAPDLQGRGLGRALLEPDRGGGPAGGHVVRPVHRCRQPAQPADVQEGRLPPARRDRARRRSRMTKSASAADFPDAGRRCWQTCSSAQSAKQDRPEDIVRRGSASSSCHRGSMTPPATTQLGHN